MQSSQDGGAIEKGASPPEIETGKIVTLDWRGTGAMTGEVLQVVGPWVKCRFNAGDTGSKPGATVAVTATVDAWVNFDRLPYYLAPRQKR
jgi:hypothetical protein